MPEGDVPAVASAQLCPCGFLRPVEVEGVIDRNAVWKELGAWDSFVCEFLYKVFVRDDIVVQFCLVKERDAGVVGHDKDCGDVAGSVSFEGRHRFGRKEMDADHGIESVIIDVVAQSVAVCAVEGVDWGFEVLEHRAHGCSHAVKMLEEIGPGAVDVKP